jgi:hypothetical protein
MTSFEDAPACVARHEWRLLEEVLNYRQIGDIGERGAHKQLAGRTRRFYCIRCRVTVVDRDEIE